MCSFLNVKSKGFEFHDRRRTKLMHPTTKKICGLEWCGLFRVDCSIISARLCTFLSFFLQNDAEVSSDISSKSQTSICSTSVDYIKK